MKKEELLDLVYLKIEEATEGSVSSKSLSPTTVILESGLDSLGYAHIMLFLEECSNKQVSEDNIDWSKIRTIDDLVCLFL